MPAMHLCIVSPIASLNLLRSVILVLLVIPIITKKSEDCISLIELGSIPILSTILITTSWSDGLSAKLGVSFTLSEAL